MSDKLSLRVDTQGGERVRHEGGFRGGRLELLLDGHERVRGEGQGDEALPEDQPLPGHAGDLQASYRSLS